MDLRPGPGTQFAPIIQTYGGKNPLSRFIYFYLCHYEVRRLTEINVRNNNAFIGHLLI